MESKTSLHFFHNLVDLSFDPGPRPGNFFRRSKLADGFDTILDMMPSLQKILLPVGHFSSNPDETPVDQLTRKLLKQPSLCPHLQDIGSHQYPTDWVVFLRMLTSRCLKSLLSPTGSPQAIHTIRFRLLPHPLIVQQLEGIMSGSQLMPYYSIHLCEESCKYSQGALSPNARTDQRNKVCFMCHSGRLEKGCAYGSSISGQDSYACLRWEDFWWNNSWEIISVSMS